MGVGKTIEALLIARELLDRGDVGRSAVLCPPHLVDQWITEMEVRFHVRAAAVTARSARRLERGVPPGESIFSVHPHTVVSLDYVKTRERRDSFLQACPDFVIVDEAHTCASSGRGRHQRHELVRGLAGSATRHLVLLTATPHSGDDDAFYRLLGLLAPDFERLADATGAERDRLRARLASHFVQRRRPDLAEWREGGLFPRRETKELTYELGGAWEAFFDDVLDYCAEVVETGAGDELRQRLDFWGTAGPPALHRVRAPPRPCRPCAPAPGRIPAPRSAKISSTASSTATPTRSSRTTWNPRPAAKTRRWRG